MWVSADQLGWRSEDGGNLIYDPITDSYLPADPVNQINQEQIGSMPENYTAYPFYRYSQSYVYTEYCAEYVPPEPVVIGSQFYNLSQWSGNITFTDYSGQIVPVGDSTGNVTFDEFSYTGFFSFESRDIILENFTGNFTLMNFTGEFNFEWTTNSSNSSLYEFPPEPVENVEYIRESPCELFCIQRFQDPSCSVPIFTSDEDMITSVNDTNWAIEDETCDIINPDDPSTYKYSAECVGYT